MQKMRAPRYLQARQAKEANPKTTVRGQGRPLGRPRTADALQTMNATLRDKPIAHVQCLPLLPLSVIAICKIKINVQYAMNVG